MKYKVLDWEKAKEICLKKPREIIYAGLKEDNCTLGKIFHAGKFVDGRPHVLSDWATPILKTKDEIIECWIEVEEDGKASPRPPRWWAEQNIPKTLFPNRNKQNAKNIVKNIHGVEVGDIFYTSWGYDQTNVCFYQVVAVTSRMATIREIRSKVTETEFMQGIKEPIKDDFVSEKLTRTKTGDWDKKNLANCDGYGNCGWLYTGGGIRYSSYA
ncbi:MAG: hypothetical protein FWC41_00440 [Firmicutes bacterium]|nr:hypothetical protein [Bacillota bacterium]